MTAGVVVLLVAVATTVAIGGVRAVTSGRFRGGVAPLTDGPPDAALDTTWHAVAAALASGPSSRPPGPGESATLVQFSSAFCAPCRATRRVLGEVAGSVPGVVHVEVDAEQHLTLVRELGVTRTPTTLVLDSTGVERTRAVGAPTRQQVLSALAG